MRISRLFIYPIKSCRGIEVTECNVNATGLHHDRRWMLVNPEGCFITQREIGRLAQVEVHLSADTVTVSAPGQQPLRVEVPRGGPTRSVRIWDDTLELPMASGAAHFWFSTFLGVPCQLVHQPPEAVRPVNPEFAQPGDQVSLADGYPVLLISEASLEDLNTRIRANPKSEAKEDLPMERFRPNVVVTGTEPYAEDQWTRFSMGDVPCDGVKACARCKITTLNPSSGEVMGKEPLLTLGTYRRSKKPSGVIFGMNVIPRGHGLVRVGDPITLI